MRPKLRLCKVCEFGGARFELLGFCFWPLSLRLSREEEVHEAGLLPWHPEVPFRVIISGHTFGVPCVSGSAFMASLDGLPVRAGINNILPRQCITLR